MALSLGRTGSRIGGVAARALMAGSLDAKGGAGIAGVRALLPSTYSSLRPNSGAPFSLARFSHSRAAPTLVMVVVHDDPELGRVYAESLSKAVSNQIAILDKVHRPPHGSDVKVEYNEVNSDANVKCPEKQPQLVSLVIDGKLCGSTEAEMETLFDHKMRTAVSGRKDDPCVAAIEQMCKNMDVALFGVKWNQQACFEKLESRSIGLSYLLEDLRNASNRRNYVESFFHETGRKIFPKKVILAQRSVMTLLPYASRYYVYGLSVYSLLACNVPLRLTDYCLIALGAQWLASDEMKDKLQDSYKYFKSGGKKEKKPCGCKEEAAGQK